MTLKEIHRIIYYFTFRFHVAVLFWLPDSSSTIPSIDFRDRLDGKDSGSDAQDVEEAGSLRFDWASYLTERLMGSLYMGVLIIPLNLIAAVSGIGFDLWKYGLFFLMAVYVVSMFLFKFDSRYNFRQFKSLSKSQSRLYAGVTAVLVTVIILCVIGSTLLFVSLSSS